MRPRMRSAYCLATIILGASIALSGRAVAPATDFAQEQAAPAAAAPETRSAPPKTLSPEDRADVFMARKNYDDAADYYSRALKQAGFKNPVLWNKLGIAYQEQTKFHNARKAYANATRLNKNFAEAWNNIGTVYFMENKYGKSLKYYQRAIELEGKNAAFHLNLGTSYFHLKKYEEAVDQFRITLSLDPNVLAARSAAGEIVRPIGDVQFYFYMAKAFARSGRAEDAVRYLRRAIEDGFTDKKRIEEDPDFKKISQDPAYLDLMKNLPAPIKE